MQESKLSSAFKILDDAASRAPGTRDEHEMRSQALDYILQHVLAMSDRIEELENNQEKA